MTRREEITAERLFHYLVEQGYGIETRKKDYEMIFPKGVRIHTLGNRYVGLKAMSRHKTTKDLVKITISSGKLEQKDVIVTTDHICMVYNDYNFFENQAAKDIQAGDCVSVYDKARDIEAKGVVEKIENMGPTEEYVYDCEVDDDSHAFYANDILVHNSQFVNIGCITDDFREKFALPEKIGDWDDDSKLKLWNFVSDFVDNDLNPFVQDTVRKWYGTEHPEVLTYALEYMGDVGIYECKKHYAVHKVVSEGPEIVDKIKYSGIELKKANVSPQIKEFLKKIYSETILGGWNTKDFSKYINEAYDRFLTMDVNEISFWKGYSTFREAEGFMKMKKMVNESGRTVGTTSISAAVTYYNQLIGKDAEGNGLGIGDKYEEILLGDKVRFTYVKPNNRYGIKYIAFKDGQYPDEFREIFEVDYQTMFDKTVISPLKGFMEACHFDYDDPSKPTFGDIDSI